MSVGSIGIVIILVVKVVFGLNSAKRVVITKYFDSKDIKLLSPTEQISFLQARRYADKHGYD